MRTNRSVKLALPAAAGAAVALAVLSPAAAPAVAAPTGPPLAVGTAGRTAAQVGSEVVLDDLQPTPAAGAGPVPAATIALSALHLPVPLPVPPTTTTTSTTTTSTDPAVTPSGGAWAALRQCESGGDYTEDTGNGYYGAYQFSATTWHGLGYPGLPSDAPPAVQDQAAARLQARSGWGQWPACSRRLGL